MEPVLLPILNIGDASNRKTLRKAIRATVATHDWTAYKPIVWVVMFPRNEVASGTLENFMFVPTPQAYADSLRKSGLKFPSDKHCFKVAGEDIIIF